MRRISLALALIGAVAATGCGGNNPKSSGTSKGTPGSTFTVEVRGDRYWDQDPSPATTTMVVRPSGGTITSTPPGINCGPTATVCSFDFAWGTPVTLTATGAGGNNYYAFAGSCQGTGSNGGSAAPFTCDLGAPNADQMVVVRFSSQFIGPHPNWSNGTLHETQVYAVNCSQCHGSMNQGAGLAPNCASCHNGSYVSRTGLVASIDTISITTPVTVQFTLRDEQGNLVDVTGVPTTAAGWSRRSQPVPITLSLNFFGVDAAGNVQNYKNATGGNPSTTTVLTNISSMTLGGNTAANYPTATNVFQYPEGLVTQGGVVCTVAAPCSCSTATPCQITGTMGYQGGRACTVAAPCTCSAANPCNAGPAAANAPGALTMDRVTGVYTFTFPAATAYPAAGSTLGNATLWLQATRQEDRANAFNAKRFTAVNLDYNFATPGLTGLTLVGARRITDDVSCGKCHNGFKAEANAAGTGWAGFHSAARISGPYCAVCHYDGRGSSQWVGIAIGSTPVGGAADSAVFVHRLHAAEEMLTRVTTGSFTVGAQLKTTGLTACSSTAACTCSTAEPCIPNAFHGMGVTYPQTPANCRECHPDTDQGNQYRTNPSRAACGACHDGVDFVTGVGHNPNSLHGYATPLAATDAQCAGCHLPAYIDGAHNIALPPDPDCKLFAGGTNVRTNCGYIAPAGKVPSGAIQLTAVVDEVFRNASGRPAIRFKLQGQTATVPAWDVVFNTSVTDGSVQPELVTSFVGSVGVYFAWAEPQDGIAAPADFNKTAGTGLKNIWNAKGTGTKGGTLSGPDVNGFYTATLTGYTIPATATMLHGGVGYQYDVPDYVSAKNSDITNQPLTQIDLAAYPFDPVSLVTGSGTGGLIVPIQNVWKVGTGYAARRAIVSNDKCNACHAFLGVGPTFHVGQRNDAPTCSFCHNPNRSNTEGGWSVNAPAFAHAIHGAKVRTNVFTWENAGFEGVEYPGSSCEQCHVAGSFNFANADSQAALGSLLFSTVSGTIVEAGTPYVTVGQALGSVGAATNLVLSPISGACFACHDSAATKTHMEAMGGEIYAPRGTGVTNNEACLSCHGAGKVLDVATVH